MQRALTLLAAALVAMSARDAAAQTPAAVPATPLGSGCPGTRQDAERDLLRLEDEWNRAGTARDAAPSAANAGAPPEDSIVTVAEAAQRADRGAEARAILERGARSAGVADLRRFYQGLIGDSHLYEGALEDAVDEIMVHAAAGRAEQALALLRLLDAVAPRAPGRAGSPQFMHAFRGYALAQGGRCDEALRALAQAPQQDRPLIHAVRATCAAKAGRRTEAIAERDETLGNPPAGVFAWPHIIARHVARQVR
jgi:tetratricopeptide (TPR) repeat protein